MADANGRRVTTLTTDAAVVAAMTGVLGTEANELDAAATPTAYLAGGGDFLARLLREGVLKQADVDAAGGDVRLALLRVGAIGS
jgi:hypothetical protein